MTNKSFAFPKTGLVVERAVLLAIDDNSLPLRKNLCYYLSKPRVRPEPVLVPNRGDPKAPDNVAAHFYGAVLQDEGRFRMWYYAVHTDEYTGPQLGRLKEGPTCYAESEDGIHWVKPKLGQFSFGGSTANNAVALPDSRTEGVHLIKDEDDPDPERRYKLIFNYWDDEMRTFSIRTATSPDGLHFTAGPTQPFAGFIEQASFYKHDGLFYVNGQMRGHSEGGNALGRQAFAVVSPDFDHWLPEQGESFLMPEPENPNDRGNHKPYDQAHIGVGAASFGNVLVGLYCMWHNKPFPTPTDWFGKGTTSGDFGLLVSNDGLHFREPVKGHVFLHRSDSQPTAVCNSTYEVILAQGNGILNVGDETRIYHGRWANTEDTEDYYAEIALATLPRDRWGALGLFPDQTEGSVWTAPVTVPEAGFGLALNADGADGFRVEIADQHFAPLSEYSGANSGTTTISEGLACPVTWPRGNPAAIGGRTVRFRVHVRKTGEPEPRLYALYLQPDQASFNR